LGAPFEGWARETIPRPIGDLRGGGSHGLPPGAWTDDTALALCLADALLADPRLEDPAGLLERFCRWQEKGENSATGVAVGIGRTTALALERFRRNGALSGPRAGVVASNGGIMRLAPIAIRWQFDPPRAARLARRQSAATHALPECLAAAEYLAAILTAALAGAGKAALATPPRAALAPRLGRLAAGGFWQADPAVLSSDGTALGTLEAALWAVAGAEDFAEALERAVGLGGDTDTAGALAGQIAGAIWGVRAIPEDWSRALLGASHVAARAEALFHEALRG
jgi:ADP-ribosyl-[dinitrogen reductase] hydrolase